VDPVGEANGMIIVNEGGEGKLWQARKTRIYLVRKYRHK
jgi:hypothetical protein